MNEALDAGRDVIEARDLKGELHAALAAELVHENSVAWVSLDVVEQESRATRSVPATMLAEFRNAVGDFRDFEDRVHWFVDMLQLTRFIEGFDPLPEVVVGQTKSPGSCIAERR